MNVHSVKHNVSILATILVALVTLCCVIGMADNSSADNDDTYYVYFDGSGDTSLAGLSGWYHASNVSNPAQVLSAQSGFTVVMDETEDGKIASINGKQSSFNDSTRTGVEYVFYYYDADDSDYYNSSDWITHKVWYVSYSTLSYDESWNVTVTINPYNTSADYDVLHNITNGVPDSVTSSSSGNSGSTTTIPSNNSGSVAGADTTPTYNGYTILTIEDGTFSIGTGVYVYVVSTETNSKMTEDTLKTNGILKTVNGSVDYTHLYFDNTTYKVGSMAVGITGNSASLDKAYVFAKGTDSYHFSELQGKVGEYKAVNYTTVSNAYTSITGASTNAYVYGGKVFTGQSTVYSSSSFATTDNNKICESVSATLNGTSVSVVREVNKNTEYLLAYIVNSKWSDDVAAKYTTDGLTSKVIGNGHAVYITPTESTTTAKVYTSTNLTGETVNFRVLTTSTGGTGSTTTPTTPTDNDNTTVEEVKEKADGYWKDFCDLFGKDNDNGISVGDYELVSADKIAETLAVICIVGIVLALVGLIAHKYVILVIGGVMVLVSIIL